MVNMVKYVDMSEEISASRNERPGESPVVGYLAEDPYVAHVVERTHGHGVVDHEVQDWVPEMVAHLQEKYGVERSTAYDAVLARQLIHDRTNGAGSRADQA